MKIVEDGPRRMYFESRRVSPRAWLIWGVLFLPGMLALAALPEAYRFAGFLGWIAAWLASVALLPRWLGDTIRVTVDAQTQAIVWARNGQITRRVPFAEVRQLDVAPLAIAARPYKTFQLIALLRNGSRITLAVGPGEAEIRRGLEVARARLRA